MPTRPQQLHQRAFERGTPKAKRSRTSRGDVEHSAFIADCESGEGQSQTTQGRVCRRAEMTSGGDALERRCNLCGRLQNCLVLAGIAWMLSIDL